MLCVMIAAAFWDIFSCTLELQVSTTHTTAGALIGMALATYGSDAVIWSKSSTTFPYVK
jgi:sodium-dependent phosphate transporter